MLSVLEVDDVDEADRRRQLRRVRAERGGLHAGHQRAPAGGPRHRHRHHLRQRAHDRRGDPAAVRWHQAHRERLPGGGCPRHRAVQPGEDRCTSTTRARSNGRRSTTGRTCDERRPHHLDHRHRLVAWRATTTRSPRCCRATSTSSRSAPRARSCGTSRAVATSTSGRASPSPTPGIVTRTWWRPSTPRSTRCSTPRSSSSTSRTSGPARRSPGWPPSSTDPKVFLCNSGAEAVDGRHQAGSRTTGRPGIIGFRRAFHGRTMGATTPHHRQGRLPGGIRPAAARRPRRPLLRADDGAATRRWRRSTGSSSTRRRPTVAAMIVEPVLGEGGYIVPPVEWLRGLRQRCDRARDPARVRRGADRLRAHRPAVRGRDLRRGARRRCSSPRASRRGCRWPGSSPVPSSWIAGPTARTARPSAATPSRAPPRSRPSRCSSREGLYERAVTRRVIGRGTYLRGLRSPTVVRSVAWAP